MCAIAVVGNGIDPDSPVPNTNASASYWWNVIQFCDNNRLTQIANTPFAHTAKLYVRVKHDNNWYPWSEITIKNDLKAITLSANDTILNFAITHKNDSVVGFIVNSQHPSDLPEANEYFVILNRDQGGNRTLVNLIPYKTSLNYVYQRQIFQDKWLADGWTKKEYVLKSDLSPVDIKNKITPLKDAATIRQAYMVNKFVVINGSITAGDDVNKLIDYFSVDQSISAKTGGYGALIRYGTTASHGYIATASGNKLQAVCDIGSNVDFSLIYLSV